MEDRGMKVKAHLKTPGTGMQRPFEVRDDGPRGRTLHTLVGVEKGEVLWKPYYFGTFKSEGIFTEFLERLSHDLQCDVLLWAYPEKGYKSIGLALDEGSYMNHGESKELLTVNHDCSAVRDLKAGEEILEDYAGFIGTNEVKWFDKLRKKAWGEEKKEQQVRVGNNGKVEKNYVTLGVPKAPGASKPVQRNPGERVQHSIHHEAPAQVQHPDLETVLKNMELETARHSTLFFSSMALLNTVTVVGTYRLSKKEQ
ncbi:MAG: hypothetical protein SGILL_006869 [Bacillariaceae sp.]